MYFVKDYGHLNCKRHSIKTETYCTHGDTWNGQYRKQNQVQEMAKKINKIGYKQWPRKSIKHRIQNKEAH
jgi:hypothetical protein